MSIMNSEPPSIANQSPLLHPSKADDIISVVIICVAAILLTLFLWFYFAPLVRNRKRKRLQRQLESQRRILVGRPGGALRSPLPSSRRISMVYSEKSPSVISLRDGRFGATTRLDPYIFDRAPTPPADSMPAVPQPAYHSASYNSNVSDQRTLYNAPSQPSPEISADSSQALTVADAETELEMTPESAAELAPFADLELPPVPLLPPIVILSNSQDSLAKGEVLVSPELDHDSDSVHGSPSMPQSSSFRGPGLLSNILPSMRSLRNLRVSQQKSAPATLSPTANDLKGVLVIRETHTADYKPSVRRSVTLPPAHFGPWKTVGSPPMPSLDAKYAAHIESMVGDIRRDTIPITPETAGTGLGLVDVPPPPPTTYSPNPDASLEHRAPRRTSLLTTLRETAFTGLFQARVLAPRERREEIKRRDMKLFLDECKGSNIRSLLREGSEPASNRQSWNEDVEAAS